MPIDPKIKILHITDFHIIDPNGTDEHLRKNFYREYIDGMVKAMKENSAFPPDIIVATGDFVEKRTAENFNHAYTVLKYVADKTNLTLNEVLVCCGNQDFDRECEVTGNPVIARKEYNEFAGKLGNRNSVIANERAVLCKPKDRVWCLLIDSTLGYNRVSSPGKISDVEIDQIVNNFIIDQNIPNEDLLVIGTHFPTENFPNSPSAYEEPDFYQKHFWSSAIPLRKRIQDTRKGGRTLWLYGDIHSSDHIESVAGFYHVVTGRLGTNRESQLRRQAKIIKISNDLSIPPEILTLEYVLPGHFTQTHYGDWNGEWGRIRSLNPPSKSQLKEHKKKGIDLRPPEEVIDAPTIEVVNAKLEKVIIDTIKRKDLYTLGRFHTSDHGVSLGWVSIGPLLNSADIIASIIPEMVDWLHKKIGIDTIADDVLLIGIDCWGAVLASQISVSLGTISHCIAARGRGKWHTLHEKINKTIIDNIEKASIVVFISDVLATGYSIKDIYDEIQKQLTVAKSSKRWISLSLFMDEHNPTRAKCEFIEIHGTVCKSLRMPVLSKTALPDVEVLPPTISFS